MLELRPIAHATKAGEVAVYVGASYQVMPVDKAKSLYDQLSIAIADAVAGKNDRPATAPIKDCPQPETPIRERAYTAEQQAAREAQQHPDDEAVDRFAAAMKAKLAEARAKGRAGWNNDEPGMQQRLSDMLREHVEKGDPRDVANFAMFLHQRDERILPVRAQQGEPVAWQCRRLDGSGDWIECSRALAEHVARTGHGSVFDDLMEARTLYTHAERPAVLVDATARALDAAERLIGSLSVDGFVKPSAKNTNAGFLDMRDWYALQGEVNELREAMLAVAPQPKEPSHG